MSDITSIILEIENEYSSWQEIYDQVIKKINLDKVTLLKINLVQTTSSHLYFNLITSNKFSKSLLEMPFASCRNKFVVNEKEITCFIVPTGIGARFGGYAGDANPIAKALSLSSKYLLTNPNVLNGAVMTDIPPNAIYLEGYYLDNFLLGQVDIIPRRKNKIGVIFDSGIDSERLSYEINVINACKSFYGCDISNYVLTEKPIDILPSINEQGFSSGTTTNLISLLESAEKLKTSGVTAIAICCRIPDLELNLDYELGKGIDPIGGVEAIISHAVSAYTGLVSAHAPILSDHLDFDYKKISPVSSSEYIAKSFLPSVISGLRFAPKIVKSNSNKSENALNYSDVKNVILPVNGFGSSSAIDIMLSGIGQVSLIKENITCLDVNIEHVQGAKYCSYDSYLNLIDLNTIEALGLSIESLKRPMYGVSKLV